MVWGSDSDGNTRTRLCGCASNRRSTDDHSRAGHWGGDDADGGGDCREHEKAQVQEKLMGLLYPRSTAAVKGVIRKKLKFVVKQTLISQNVVY